MVVDGLVYEFRGILALAEIVSSELITPALEVSQSAEDAERVLLFEGGQV
jgi:hypothetical protein